MEWLGIRGRRAAEVASAAFAVLVGLPHFERLDAAAIHIALGVPWRSVLDTARLVPASFAAMRSSDNFCFLHAVYIAP
jgi:hypothetical protein